VTVAASFHWAILLHLTELSKEAFPTSSPQANLSAVVNLIILSGKLSDNSHTGFFGKE